jgi:uncharacterized protein YkwD
MLLLTLPAGASAASVRGHRASTHIRHRAHHPAHRRAKRRCGAHKADTHIKRAPSCPKHRKHGRRTHKRAAHHTHKRVVRHARNTLPATASRDCPNANLIPKADNIESVVAATLCLINDERARFGEAALIEDPRLAGAAVGHSRDMDARDYFEHVSPGGQTLLMRIRDSGFIPNGNVGYALGENIAWGTLWLGAPRGIVKAWMESPGHRANILNASYRYTGVGVDPSLPHSMSGGQAGGMYTQDFGAIISN